MTTKKIFIASSAELKLERMELVDLIMDLDLEWKELGIRFESELWESIDSSMRAKRKEDEYIEKLKECNVCLVLFWKTLGQYTVEELNIAISEMQAGRLPQQVHVLYKSTDDEISANLQVFKELFAQQHRNISCSTFDSIKKMRDYVTQILTQDYSQMK